MKRIGLHQSSLSASADIDQMGHMIQDTADQFIITPCVLKDKSGVLIIVDYSRDYTVVNGVVLFSINFFPFNLRNYIFQSAEKCEMTSFYMTSIQVDLNEAAKCVDIIPFILLASSSLLCTLAQNTK